jgi:glyoxylase-like metal-dependent hydrolase (beta-lactamase superfamily II)
MLFHCVEILQVIEAPVVSHGSICFYCEKENLLGGDVLFYKALTTDRREEAEIL